jgi:hypothetical protein
VKIIQEDLCGKLVSELTKTKKGKKALFKAIKQLADERANDAFSQFKSR